MDIISPSPFWPVRSGLLASYATLAHSVRCEVVIVGAGVSGALLADTLSATGYDVVVIDKRDVATGSTSASTALLQYEIDVSLMELARQRGEADAARAYRACARGVELIAERAASLDAACGFERKQSIYLASDEKAARSLPAECEARQRAGLAVELWTKPEIEARFSFSAPAALHSTGAAQIDPYRFTHAMLARSAGRGCRIFDRTPEVTIESGVDRVVLKSGDATITAEWLVVAAGYEAVKLLPRRVVALKSSFALVSEPIADFSGWWDRCLLWETAQPYCYLRTTDDGRFAIIGGGGRSVSQS